MSDAKKCHNWISLSKIDDLDKAIENIKKYSTPVFVDTNSTDITIDGRGSSISLEKTDYQKAQESSNPFKIGDRVLIYRTPTKDDPACSFDSKYLFNYGRIKDIDLTGIWLSFDREDEEDPILYAFPYYVLRKF